MLLDLNKILTVGGYGEDCTTGNTFRLNSVDIGTRKEGLRSLDRIEQIEELLIVVPEGKGLSYEKRVQRCR